MARKLTTTAAVQAPRVPVVTVVSSQELHWLGVLSEHATAQAVMDDARTTLADGVREIDVRHVRVAVWSNGGMARMSEFAPGGLGVTAELEVKRARAWREAWASPDLRNGETALFRTRTRGCCVRGWAQRSREPIVLLSMWDCA